MSNKCILEIVYKNWPDKLEAWIRVDKKLEAMKNISSTENNIVLDFDPDEKEVFNKVMEYLVSEYKTKRNPLVYLADKFAPSAFMLILREAIGKI